MTRADHGFQEAIRAFANHMGQAADWAYRVLGHASRLRKITWVLTPDQRAELNVTFTQLTANQRAAAALVVNTNVTQARALATEEKLFSRLGKPRR